MSNENIIKIIENTILKDFQKSLEIEKKYHQEAVRMEQMGLGRSNGYLDLIEEKLTISYFTAYLYRLFEVIRTIEPSNIKNISPEEMKIKRNIQMWKKNDIKDIRKMRKKVGNGGVDLMKRSINSGISRLNKYIEVLAAGIKDL
jgi:hypothetical protein|tara:strand:- start:1356 stop:1787 length:432 start_codon:yes stop_codon:yes gene_type:complete